MSERIRIAVDAMGGDNAPHEIVAGVLEALRERTGFDVILIGKQELIEAELRGKDYPKERVEILHASEVIEMAEPPVAAIRSKTDSSIAVGLRLVRDKKADTFVSGGNSGAVLVGGQGIVGRIKGITRPPFAAIIPTEKGTSLLLDCGANVDVRADHLVSFARIGSIYMEQLQGIENPQVGILNIGAEDDKGNALVKEALPLLRECSDLNFIGSIEARDIPGGACDVIVCDGFAGNIVLKMYEGTAGTMLRIIKKGLMSSLISKIGALLIKGALKKTLKDYDASEYGGAPLLGLNGLVVKMHGSCKAKEVKNTMFQCVDFTQRGISDKIRTIAQEELSRQGKKTTES